MRSCAVCNHPVSAAEQARCPECGAAAWEDMHLFKASACFARVAVVVHLVMLLGGVAIALRTPNPGGFVATLRDGALSTTLVSLPLACIGVGFLAHAFLTVRRSPAAAAGVHADRLRVTAILAVAGLGPWILAVVVGLV